MNILVTGASGFVGQALTHDLVLRGFNVIAVVRKAMPNNIAISQVIVNDICDKTDWIATLTGVDVIVHLAARVHVMQESATNPIAEFRRLNVAATEHLARSAALAGVKRFVFVSSIKVNGEEAPKGYPYTEQDIANPQDPYGISKFEAELALQQIAKETGLELVIVRPPLVYGTGVKGNFAQMIAVVKSGLPLPLANIDNKRSFIFVKNLSDALILCAKHPAAAGKTYLVSDSVNLSTSQLLRKLSVLLGKKSRLFPFPIGLLKFAGKLLGKSEQITRLTGSLQIDSSKIRNELGWAPPYTVDEGLIETVNALGRHD